MGLSRLIEHSQTGSALPSVRRAALLGFLVLLLSTPGCASNRPGQSGYLSDYSQLVKDPIHLNHGLGLERAKSHNATPEAIFQIDSFYIEPVQWLVDESSRAGGDPVRRADLIATLDKALRDELGGLKPIVDQPGPRTARVRSAITTVNLSRPILNLVILASFIGPVGVGPIFNGGGLVEAEIIGPDGRQMAATSVASSGGPLDFFGYYAKSGHPRKAMRRSAQELRETIAK